MGYQIPAVQIEGSQGLIETVVPPKMHNLEKEKIHTFSMKIENAIPILSKAQNQGFVRNNFIMIWNKIYVYLRVKY